MKLKAGRGKAYRLKFVLPQDLPAGTYTLQAVIDANNEITESDETNNAATSDETFAV